MGSRHELYNRLMGRLNSLVEVSHLQHLTNWTWIVVGILQANSIALSKMANHIPSEAEAESRVTTLRRWLKNLKIEVWALYRRVLEQVLAGWHAVEATVCSVIGCKSSVCRGYTGIARSRWSGKSFPARGCRRPRC